MRDGDDLMVLFALDLIEGAGFAGGLAVTSMTNLGLHRRWRRARSTIVETDVGDRNVLLALEERAWDFGGEQSGHLIFRDRSPTGDGLLTGMLLCDLVARRGPLNELAEAAWRRVPQELINVSHDRYDDAAVRALFDAVVAEYGVDEPTCACSSALGHRAADPRDGRGARRAGGRGVHRALAARPRRVVSPESVSGPPE